MSTSSLLGIVIANTLFRRLPLRPWRFDAAAYRAAAGGGKPLGEGRVEACWDSELATAMAERGVAVEEEAVLAGLLEELGG